MSKIKVLFFAADPLSAGPDGREPRLLLDENVRQIRRTVRAAKHRDALEIVDRWAVRTDDLFQSLNEMHPAVVHFSGHGGSEGLVLVGADGQSGHPVEAEALAALFEVFHGDIRLVVLSACFSLPQAEAIRDVVGCAIGTRSEISDKAAITFDASFYRAIAFGHPVRAAYEQARAALKLDHFDDRECPVLLARHDVDPSTLFLIRPRGRVWRLARRMVASTATFLLSSGVAVAGVTLLGRVPDEPSRQATKPFRGEGPMDTQRKARPRPLETGLPESAGASTIAPDPAGAAAELTAGKAFHESGNHAAAVAAFERAAAAGSTEAMGWLGVAYLRGEGTDPNPQLAVYWLRQAVDARDARGMNGMGMAYEMGVGVARSDHWARHWYEAAAREKNFAEAMRNLGSLHLKEMGVDSSYERALGWFHKAADAGSLEALVDAGHMYEAGLVGGRRNLESALRSYQAAAKAGLPRGMFAMGRIYQEGVVVPRDYGEARAWYIKAVDAGSADAMNNMGILYQNGWGVRKSRAEAARWYRRAAAAGSAEAQGNLGALEATRSVLAPEQAMAETLRVQ